jgi:hypothetical protein
LILKDKKLLTVTNNKNYAQLVKPFKKMLSLLLIDNALKTPTNGTIQFKI